MKYFLDSAKLDEIEEAYETFGIDGITTNPRHVQASGKSIMDAIEGMAKWAEGKKLTDYRRFPISVEINPHLEKADDMIREAKRIASISKNFVIKIPCNPAGITAARALERDGVRTNVTLVFVPTQALLAAKNKALFVSPFVGWKEANGEDTQTYIRQIVDIYRNYAFETEIICASVRSGKQIVDCAVAGAHIATAGLQVYKDSITHPYTRDGLDVFCDAWDKTKQ
ncbi:MAG: transaldolase [Planctomycetaceae bacterium]|nr:transaldolase [Planctomycetaceae bacterium]